MEGGRTIAPERRWSKHGEVLGGGRIMSLSETATSTHLDPASAAAIEAGLLAHVDGDRDLLKEVIVIFLDTCPSLMETLRQALQNREFGAVVRAAHSLRGSASNFDATQVTTLAQQIESHASRNNLPELHDLFAKLESEVAALTTALATMATTL
jgi:HPt (histidine-containing phosphotransfer) domain-containing protein